MTKKAATKSTSKVAKKTAAHKSTSKKAAAKRVRKKEVFKKIPDENFFVLADGRRVENFITLAHLLEDLEEDIIRHHVSDLHNDFANWIHDVFSEDDLAKKIKTVNNPEKIRLIIYKHIIDKHLK